jgi:large subunit ribosomal protein L5e
MVFVKVVKNRSYFSRFQVKWRRRREGKTNYRKRRQMITQDKNKYNTPKYRLVVRRTNRDIIAQIVLARIQGDYVVASAYAHQLVLHGALVGLTNYAAAYATGLLLARRVLTKFGLAKKYEGVVNPTGELYNIEAVKGARRPFKAFLDTGLARTTTGARIFGVLKGAVDGGINVPHSEKRFPGFNREKGELDSGRHRARIFASHIAEYHKLLLREEPEDYKEKFSKYVEAGITPDKVEKMWANCHASIRRAPLARYFDETYQV